MSDEPIIIPTPIVIKKSENRLLLLAKVLSWASVFMFTLAMALAIINADRERTELRTQLGRLQTQLICRTSADDQLQIDLAQRDIIITQALVAVSRNDDAMLASMTDLLEEQNVVVAQDIDQLRVALEACSAD